ncbi:adenylosuccinate lyase [Saliphagus infecundisoli]|uniref:Adenylosuccinate lyase n=1 Tax=Saliphagus infecundisoli TaxID=1849069 RepID=A0ABD5QE29_9EURY|nr:adenylosuccinate lyase [Saliphagus infecundisoli]
MADALYAVSPIDGRYGNRTAALSPYASEAALMRARLRVEVEYLIALAELDATALELDLDERNHLRKQYNSFAEEDAELIKKIEVEGHGPYEATNHDVKAVEYFLRYHLPEGSDASPWIHFGLTSEDVNNLAHRLLLADAVEDVLLPELFDRRTTLAGMAREHRDLPMLARTHGQPATPTTFGKEMAVYAARLGRATGRLEAAGGDLRGKLGGASGTYGAHVAAYPEVDWPAFAREFVTDLGLEFEPLTTQVNPCDDLAVLFDALRGVNDVLIDLDRDVWLYVSDRYLGQATTEGETGSSTMPHKVNPIDFENSEGNLSKANSDLTFLADYVTTSRLQRDLSDSTVKRNIGTALAHCLIGYEKTGAGLEKVVPNEAVMREELRGHPEVIGEAIQTILRREGYDDAYERVKALTRGETVTIEDLRAIADDPDLDSDVGREIRALSPETYVGVASDLIGDMG